MNTVLREKYEGVAQNIMPEGYLEAPLAYDAIWAVALALNRTMARLVSNGKKTLILEIDNLSTINLIRLSFSVGEIFSLFSILDVIFFA